MFLSTIGAVVGIAGGINSLTGGAITDALGFGGSGNNYSGSQAMAAGDPFSPYRANLGAMYAGALQPGKGMSPEAMPGFSQWKSGVLDPALQASQRQAAGAGMLYSGNEATALQSTAQKGYYGFMTDYLNRLAQGSGAVNNPAQAAALGINQGNLNQQGVAQGFGAISQGLGSLSNIFNSGGGGYSDAWVQGASQQMPSTTEGLTVPVDNWGGG